MGTTRAVKAMGTRGDFKVEQRIEERVEPSPGWSRMWAWLMDKEGDPAGAERGHKHRQAAEPESDASSS